MIERIDHLLAVVADHAAARRAWIEAGCPVVWDGRIGRHHSLCVSLGPVNLEILSEEVFVGWPPLGAWPAWTARRYGLHAAALDPGDLDATAAELRARGLDPSPPREGGLVPPADAPPGPSFRWRLWPTESLTGLLPGLPSFLCEFISPAPSLGRSMPESPVRFVELTVGTPDPEAAASGYRRLLGVEPVREDDSILVPLADTPIRLRAGRDLVALLAADAGVPNLDALSGTVPGVSFDPAPRRQ